MKQPSTQTRKPRSLSQTHNHQTQKQRADVSIGAERPLKRARLTKKNLEILEKMGGRERKSAGKKATGQSTTITTTDKDFGPRLQQNNIVHTIFEAPDDIEDVKKLLDRRRESESPSLLDYQRYVIVTADYENELGVEISAYPLLAKRTSREVEISGYFQRPNHAWSAVDNHLTTGLSDPQPDLVESYRKNDYPLEAVEALSADLAPSSYNEAMPAYAVEFKSPEGSMREAQLQCAFDGSIMTEGAYGTHKYMNKSDDDFYGKTQALTVTFNGRLIEYYGHHALQTPGPSQLVGDKAKDKAKDTVKYHQYLLDCDNPRASLQNFQRAYKHIRNAQDIGYKWATERKDALWAYTNRDNTQTSPDVATPVQQQPSNTNRDNTQTSSDVATPVQQQPSNDSLVSSTPNQNITGTL